MSRRRVRSKILAHAALVPFLVFALFPFYHMTLTSLKTDRELYDRAAPRSSSARASPSSTTRSSSGTPRS